ncbi:MAG: GNAT family N-acetyltransferase [Cyanobacteria bacterium P01_E01_bin.34]
MHVPTAIAPSDETARAVIEVVRGKSANLLTSWLGGESANLAQLQFAEANISTYDTPDDAVRAFLHLVRFQLNQDLLMETPPSTPTEFKSVTARAHIAIQQALAEGRHTLTEPEAKAILAAYGIPIVETKIASGTEDAIRAAREIGFPVAVKIVSPDVSHKSDVGGVALDLASPAELESAIQSIQGRIDKLCPDAEFKGFAVQKMARRSGAHELIVGTTTDPVFGPILLFGQGGTAVEAIGDRAVGLPPLNVTLARELMSRTRVSRLLHGYRDRPAADNKAIELTLIQISQLIIDIPEIVELDINPLLADDNGVLALDARIAIAPATQAGTDRLAIRPYPVELEESIQLRSGRKLLLRPIRPEDEPAHYGLFEHLSAEDIRFRFFGMVKKFPQTEMARFTQIDYDREMAFIALVEDEPENNKTLGVVRAITDFENERAEFAIVVRTDMKGQGLGHALLKKMIRYCRDRGYKDMMGEVLANNKAMLNLARSCGFASHPSPEPDIVEVLLQL